MIKNLLFIFLLFVSTNLACQIKIAPMNFDWVNKVDSALLIIEKYDSTKYDIVQKYCKEIGFWNGKFSTTEEKHIITITKTDIEGQSVNNVAAVIIHESKHLEIINLKFKYDLPTEEIICYKYEKEFLLKIPNVEKWLLDNTDKQIKLFNGY